MGWLYLIGVSVGISVVTTTVTFLILQNQSNKVYSDYENNKYRS